MTDPEISRNTARASRTLTPSPHQADADTMRDRVARRIIGFEDQAAVEAESCPVGQEADRHDLGLPSGPMWPPA
jgi:hypothetical protein